MFVLVLAAEADETRQAITFLILCLVGIAVLLALLTLWYWIFTSPKRRLAATAKSTLASADEVEASGSDPDRSATLSESSELLNRTLSDSDDPTDTEADSAEREPHRIEVPDRSPAVPEPAAAETGSIESAPAEQAPTVPVGGTRKPVERIPAAAASTVRVTKPISAAKAQSKSAAKAQSKSAAKAQPEAAAEPQSGAAGNGRPKAERTQEALSDDAWAAAMKSAFDKLHS